MTAPITHRRPNPRAFTLVEAVISIVITSVMLVAALRTVAAARSGQIWNSDRLRAIYLAQDLMAEITSKPYTDPGATPLFGPEGAEIVGGRSTYDDVDDYNGLSESPPKDRSGTSIPGATSWTRAVTVIWVMPADLTQTSLIDRGAKLITVTVSRNNATLAKLVEVRTSATPR